MLLRLLLLLWGCYYSCCCCCWWWCRCCCCCWWRCYRVRRQCSITTTSPLLSLNAIKSLNFMSYFHFLNPFNPLKPCLFLNSLNLLNSRNSLKSCMREPLSKYQHLSGKPIAITRIPSFIFCDITKACFRSHGCRSLLLEIYIYIHQFQFRRRLFSLFSTTCSKLNRQIFVTKHYLTPIKCTQAPPPRDFREFIPRRVP